MAQGKEREAKKDWDGALDFYNKALAEDPSDPGYQLYVHQARFQAGPEHIKQGLKLRKDGQLAQALHAVRKSLRHRSLFERCRAGNQDDYPNDRAGEKKRP